jgi:hypothetical protein
LDVRHGFEDFRKAHGVDYEALDARCEGWTAQEIKIGSWTVMA